MSKVFNQEDTCFEDVLERLWVFLFECFNEASSAHVVAREGMTMEGEFEWVDRESSVAAEDWSGDDEVSSGW